MPSILSELKQIKSLLLANKEVMRLNEAALYLGVCDKTMDRIKKKVGYSQPVPGGAIFFRKKDLDRYIDESLIESTSSIEMKAANHLMRKSK